MTDNRDGKAYLACVLEKLNVRIAELDDSILEGQKDIEEMHQYYWENYTEMDQYGYEDYDNRQALLRTLNANEEEHFLRQRFRKMLDSPFFGRVDFRFAGEEQPEIFYIGIGNFSEKTGQVPMVYDWRAPVSGLFYDYDKGPASYEAPLGIIEGDITAKWQYKIRGGKMIYAFESDIKIDDEILGAELALNGAVQLKNIVRTIQKEQNAIIRNTSDRIMVIQGAAGSGKTSIALHRIAYLLYHERQNLKSSHVLILSPNSVFSDYISHILPELGEENIQEMSFDLFAYRQLQEIAADCEDHYDQIERTLRFPKGISLYEKKQSREFLKALEGFLLELEDSLMNFREVKYKGYVKTEAQIIDLFYFKFMEVPLLSRMEAVADYFIDEIETLRNVDMEEDERLLVTAKFLSMYETRDLYLLYNQFLAREGYPTLPPVSPEKRRLLYEDVYPLLYLKLRLLHCREHHQIRHLVIDEMQDYSRIQYEIIRRLFPCRMTVLGDRAQTMEERQQDVLTFLPGIFGKDIRRIVLNKSYRNTVEIAEYANRLAGIEDMELFERHGEPVEERTFATLEEAAQAIVSRVKVGTEEDYETAAVILRTEKEAEVCYEVLARRLEQSGFHTEKRLHYLDRNSQSFQKGLTVTTFYLAKGLEFDQVFSLFPSEDQSPLSVQGRYIAATRALHELHMYEAEEAFA